MAGAMGSKVGRLMRRRRHDLRMLVGAGAASAIAGAFAAPFAGAAYGFELIIGSYTVGTLAPVAVAAIAGRVVSRSIAHQGFRIQLEPLYFTGGHQFLFMVVIGVTCGLLAVAVMRGATATEHLARSWSLRSEGRPVAGGVVLASLGWLTPMLSVQDMGALNRCSNRRYPLHFWHWYSTQRLWLRPYRSDRVFAAGCFPHPSSSEP